MGGILGVQGRGEGCTLSSNSRFSAFGFGSWYSTPCCRGAQRAAHFFSMARTGGRKGAGLTAYRPDTHCTACTAQHVQSRQLSLCDVAWARKKKKKKTGRMFFFLKKKKKKKKKS